MIVKEYKRNIKGQMTMEDMLNERQNKRELEEDLK